MGSVGALRLQVHPVDAVVHVEVVDVDRTGECLQRREYVGYGHSQQLGLVPVDVEIQLWDVLLHRARYAGELLALRCVIDQTVGCGLKLLVGAVAAGFQSHLDSSRGPQARNDRRRAGVDLALGIERQRICHHLHHLRDVPLLALVPGLEHHGELGIGLARSDTGRRTDHAQHVLYVRLAHEEFHGPVGHHPRALQS